MVKVDPRQNTQEYEQMIYEIAGPNVNHTYPQALALVSQTGLDVQTRNGLAREVPCPVMTTTLCPEERVLFDPVRDANPYLHFFECLWIMAGRRDAKFVGQFSKNILAYAEDDGNHWGAYGYRLRHAFGFDQIGKVVKMLKEDPTSRRIVLQMWDADRDLAAEKKDLPCNTHIYLDTRGGKLNMGVMNRSNDLVWGCYGTNVVHFSFLLEYLAIMAKLEVGVMRQYSHNLHYYHDNPTIKKWDRNIVTSMDYYVTGTVSPYAIADSDDCKGWEKDLADFMNDPLSDKDYTHGFFGEVARPLYASWHERKNGKNDGHAALEYVKATDWRLAAQMWIDNREREKAK
jgi:hypothetical protein